MSKEHDQGMSLIVKTVTRYTVGLIFLYGVYIVLHGHLSPGGGFSGGVIIALSFIHLMLAFGKEKALSKLPRNVVIFLGGFGVLMFWSIALLGFMGGTFFLNLFNKGEPYRLFSAGMIPLCNVAICFNVGAGLFAIFVALVTFQLSARSEKEK